MNKQSLIIIIFIAITAWIVWQYFMPSFEEVSALRRDLKTWQGKLNDAKGLSKKLEELKKKYDSMPSEVNRVAQAVTKRKDLPGLLVQTEELSSKSGLLLEDVVFSENKKTKQALSSADEVKVLAIDLNLNGSQSSLKIFLKAIEANLRIMDVFAISFGERDLGDSLGQDFKVSLNTYFRE